jgi:hypothetical protein
VTVRSVMELLSRKSNESISDHEWIELLKLQSHMQELKGMRKELVQSYGAAALSRTKNKDVFSQDFACQLASMVRFKELKTIKRVLILADHVQCTHSRYTNSGTPRSLSRSFRCVCESLLRAQCIYRNGRPTSLVQDP